jgi:hypothetical protein
MEKSIEPPRCEGVKIYFTTESTENTEFFCFYLTRINWIIWIIFLYLKFPEEIPNEQSATPRRKTLAWCGIGQQGKVRDILPFISFFLFFLTGLTG